MKKKLFSPFLFVVVFLFMAFSIRTASAAIYVDSRNGSDQNDGAEATPVRSLARAYSLLEAAFDSDGVIRLNPGVHLVVNAIRIQAESEVSNRTIVIEASVMPDEPEWTPEKMPVLVCGSAMGEIDVGASDVFTVLFAVERSGVTLRGLKFLGYPHPNTRYIPILRIDRDLERLKVEQCLFVADKENPIQVGILADGGGIQIDHCVFYNARNAVVFWRSLPNQVKRNNAFTNSIVYGAYQSAIWTSEEDENLVFENNVVTKCEHFWIKNHYNQGEYAAENCVVVDNAFHQVVWEQGLQPRCFGLKEVNVRRKGEVILVKQEDVDDPIPHDYLHLKPGTFGHEIGAGIFKRSSE